MSKTGMSAGHAVGRLLQGVALVAATALPLAQPNALASDADLNAEAIRIVLGPGQAINVLKVHREENDEAALVFLHGDLPYSAPSDASEIGKEAASLARTVEALRSAARAEGITVYHVARPGFHGSSGDRREKLGREHYALTARAVDELIGRENLGRVALVGHSGGGRAAMAHAILSGHPGVKCYALSSGNYVAQYVVEHQDALRGGAAIGEADLQPLRPTIWFDITSNLDGMPVVEGRRFLLLADRRDKVVPFFLSEMLARALRRRGHPATLIESSARGPMFHDLGLRALREAASCLREKRGVDPLPPHG